MSSNRTSGLSSPNVAGNPSSDKGSCSFDMRYFNTVLYIIRHPLSRGRRLRNLLRLLRWQVQSRISSAETTVCFVNGTRMYMRRGMTGATGNHYVGLDEFEDMALLLHFLRPEDLFVDVGANVGSYTVLAAGAVGAKVIAFEPGAAARKWLNRNIVLNDVTARVEVRHEAVGERCGTASFTKDLGTTNHLVLPSSQGRTATETTETVSVTTLDQMLDGRVPAMLKADVEGFETQVVRGAETTLENPALQCVLLELGGAGAQYGFDEHELRRRMTQLGFSVCSYDPFERRLTPGDIKTIAGRNTLFVKDIAYVADRLATAKPFRVLDKSI